MVTGAGSKIPDFRTHKGDNGGSLQAQGGQWS